MQTTTDQEEAEFQAYREAHDPWVVLGNAERELAKTFWVEFDRSLVGRFINWLIAKANSRF